jgi:hypothetical protein
LNRKDKQEAGGRATETHRYRLGSFENPPQKWAYNAFFGGKKAAYRGLSQSPWPEKPGGGSTPAAFTQAIVPMLE